MKTLTVLICTRNGARTIGAAIQSVRAQRDIDVGQVELVVVDNGSTDDTVAIVESAIAVFPMAARVVFEPREGKLNPFLRGVREAVGTYVTVLDDDNIISQSFLSKSIEFLDQFRDVGLVGSRNRLSNSVEPGWFAEVSSYFACKEPLLTGHVLQIDTHRRISDAGLIAGAGSTFRRGALVEALEKGFFFLNDTFRGRTLAVTGEDIELCFLMQRLGWRFGFDSGLELEHIINPARLDLRYARQLCQSIGAGLEAVDLLLAGADGSLEDLKTTWWWRAARRTKRLAGLHVAALNARLTGSHEHWPARHVEYGALRRCLKERGDLRRRARERERQPWSKLLRQPASVVRERA